jgi:peptidoglycan-associated lipoprotein
MKRWILMFAVVGLLAGCASPDTQKPATIEERTPTTGVTPTPPKGPTGPTVSTAPPTTVGQDDLNDPKSILSRRSVYFDYDQYVVKEEFKPLVTAHAQYLSRNRNARMTVQGNTDDRGSREYNLALGQRRADAVKQQMTLLGAQASQIETVSFGKEKPRAQGANEQAWAENRRADIVY